MQVCLISPPTVTEFEGTVTSRSEAVHLTADYPPLGVLSLAAILEQQGIAHCLFDLNRLFWDVAGSKDGELEGGFFARAVSELEQLRADVFGFGTISSSYPLTVRLARELKRMHPEAVIVFGGPQASAVDVQTLEAFSFVDVIVRGEAEEVFPRLLEALSDPGRLADGVPSLTFRAAGRVLRTPDAPALPDLDRLPLPAFHLWPGIENRQTIPLEVGRGCPFDCSFCSTSRFFRRRFRLKAPGRVIEHMRSIRQSYHIGTFHFVHDSFTAVRAKVVEFCRVLLDSGDQFHWTCSARTDTVDDELLALMAQAGCTGIFFGVETGSSRVQRAIHKALDIDEAREVIRCADRHRMRTTVSLVTGFPGETPDDLRHTVHFLLDCLQGDNVQAQFHLLAPLAGSDLHDEYRGRIDWDGIFSDMAFQGWRQDSNDLALIRGHPEIFPNFYAIPTAWLDRSYLMELRDFLVYGLARFRWLMIAVHHHSGDVLKVFDQWRAWRAQHRPSPRADGEYHASDAFGRGFLDFIASEYLKDDDSEALAVVTLLEYEAQLERLGKRDTAWAPPVLSAAGPSPAASLIPRVAPGVALVKLGADYQGLIACLRSGRSPREVSRRPVTVADRELPNGSVEVVQLSRLAAALLDLCDGTRTVKEIASVFSQLDEGLERLAPEPACAFSLNELARQGLVLFIEAAQLSGPTANASPRVAQPIG